VASSPASLLALRAPSAPSSRGPAGSRQLGWKLSAIGSVIVLVGVAAAVVLPGLRHPVPPLGRIPVARAVPGSNGLAVEPDPATTPSAFATAVSGSIDSWWRRAFGAMGLAYRPPTLDLFGYATSIPCFPLMDFNDGPPYYCYLDDTIYLPVQYISDLATATGPLATVAVAYVLAHEYAHHVQYLTGLGATVEYQEAKPGAAAERASIAYELQADCLAGVWLSTVVAPGALDRQALAGAQETAVLLHGGEGALSADSHGTLPQRQAALWRGYTSGRASSCLAS